MLVDLFNVGPGAKTDRDYEDLMTLVGDLIRGSLVNRTKSSEVHDIDCRLYGGFTSIRGTPTEQYSRTLKKIRLLRTLEDRVRIKPHIAKALALVPQAMLIGTYKNGGQKMVDQMLALDACHFAESAVYDRVCIIANDDDYVPAVLTMSRKYQCPISWLRKRATAENDQWFGGTTVSMLYDGAWK